MIEFSTIKWKNFLSTGNSFTELDLKSHQLSLMVGKNGAGKSTFLDALSFVLFGKPFRNINKNLLINSINKKNTMVEVVFNIGSSQYKITRGIKPNVFEIYCNDQLIDQNAEQKEYQEMLEKHILKLNHKSFNQVVVLGSASFVPFMQLTAASRREIIEDILDIEIFTKMNVLLKEKISKNKEDIQQCDFDVKNITTKISIEQKHLDEKKQNIETNIDDKSKQKNKIKRQIAKNEKILGGLEEQRSQLELEKTYDDLIQKKIDKRVLLKNKLEQKVKDIDSDIEFFQTNDNCPTCKQILNETFKNSSVEAKQQQKSEYVSAIEKLDKEIEGFGNTNIDEIDRKINKICTEILQIQMTIGVDQRVVNSIDADIKVLKEDKQVSSVTEIEDLTTSLNEKKQEYQKLVEDKKLLEVASLLLKDSGIKTRIIRQYIPVMNKLINKYLAAMDFFVNFELNENFEETIKSRFRDEFVYGSFSEGEKMRIDLALLFTWRAIAKQRNSIATNILIMDEVFDSSLDGDGVEEFMKILQQLTKGNNTFIISHKGDQLFDKFENVIKFEKVKNFSRIMQ